jgi:hypothetical protein
MRHRLVKDIKDATTKEIIHAVGEEYEAVGQRDKQKRGKLIKTWITLHRVPSNGKAWVVPQEIIETYFEPVCA